MNSNEWVNIQDIVRIAFKHVCDKLHHQDAQLQNLYSEFENLISKDGIKSDIVNIESQISEMNSKIDQSVDKLENISKTTFDSENYEKAMKMIKAFSPIEDLEDTYNFVKENKILAQNKASLNKNGL